MAHRPLPVGIAYIREDVGEPGTRLHAEQQFREGGIQVLAATEAAGEGINLQCAAMPSKQHARRLQAVQARLDFYRAQAVDGLGRVVQERLFAVELDKEGTPTVREPRYARKPRSCSGSRESPFLSRPWESRAPG